VTSNTGVLRTLTIGTEGILVNSGAGAVTIGDVAKPMNVGMSGAQSWTNNSVSTLTIVNGVTNGGFLLTSSGSGNTIINGVISGIGGLTKTGGQTLTLNATNVYTGATAVNAGTLLVNGSIGNSAVTVSNAGTVLATDAAASFGSTVAIDSGAILSPGNTGAAGTATVAGATTFNKGSIFSWDINSTGTSYDKLITSGLVDGDGAGGSVLQIVVGDTTFGNAFWNINQTWTDIFTTNGTSPIANWANIFTDISLVNSSLNPITTGRGSFSVSGNTLTWNAVPEPSSALAGILLGLGLLRRRRR